MKRKKKLRFIYLQVILAVYIIMFGVVLSVGRNVLYSSKKACFPYSMKMISAGA